MAATDVIALVGASVRAAVFSALRAGLVPVAADCFADADLRRLGPADEVDDYPAGLAPWLAAAARARPGVAWLYTGALENHAKLLAKMSVSAPLLGNQGVAVEQVRSPRFVAATLAQAGLCFPETRSKPLGLPRDGSWLSKTYRGAGGNGIAELRNGRRPQGAQFQRRIPGIPASAVYVANGEKAVCLGVTRQLIGLAWTGASGFKYCGSIGPWPVSRHLRQQVDRVGDSLASAARLVGLFGIDFIVSGETLWTVEVNPRYTASVEVLEQATGLPAMELHIEACAGRLPQHTLWPVGQRACIGKAVLYAQFPMIITESFSQILLDQAGHWTRPAWADIPRAGTSIAAGQPVLTAFASACSCEKVFEELKRRAAVGQQRIERARISICR